MRYVGVADAEKCGEEIDDLFQDPIFDQPSVANISFKVCFRCQDCDFQLNS
jgi:hypothetical protein